MSLLGLMDELAALHIELRLENGKLRYKAPEGALTPDLRERIGTWREALVARLEGRPQSETLWCAPSPAQEGLWFFDHVQGPNGIYNIPVGLSLRGRLDRAALRQVLDDLVLRHQALRASFHHDGHSLRLKIEHDLSAPWSEEEITGPDELTRMMLFQERAAETVSHCFDLSSAPLLQAVLFTLGPEEHVLVINVHHIVVDGWSVGIIVQEIAAGYEARSAGREPSLPALAWQYADCLAWQEMHAGDDVQSADLEFWRNGLAGAPACSTMPTDFPRPILQGYDGAAEPLFIDKQTTARLRSRAREWGVSMNHVMLAATAFLLSEFSGKKDMVIGMPIASRNRRELETVVGMFVNIVPLRIIISSGMSLGDLVDSVRRVSTAAMAHASLPFESLVKRFAGEKDLSMSPLFQVACDFLPPMGRSLTFGNLDADILDIAAKAGISKYDSTFYFDEKDGALAGSVEFNTRLYRPESVRRWAKAYADILDAMLNSPEILLKSLSLLGSSDRELLDSWCSGPVVPLPDGSPWFRFERAALENPDAAALKEGDLHISYRELLKRAEIISARLADRSIGKGDRVGLFLPRGSDQVAAMLGVVRRGAVFVPFDVSHPVERIKAMVARVQLRAMLAHAGDEVTEGLACEKIGIGGYAWDAKGEIPEPVHSCMEDPIYMIFTSGSTGTPKAVSISWQGLCNVVQAYAGLCSLSSSDRISSLASCAFDASLIETWPSLLSGATLVFVPFDVRLDPELLRDWILREGVTVHLSPTTTAEELLLLDWPVEAALRLMTTGGQTLHFHPPSGLPFRFVNIYGPTEYSIAATWCELGSNGGDAGLPPVGSAIDNTRIAVLDETQRRVPPGVVGELYITGAGVSLGYYGDPVTTAEKFVTLPGDTGSLWYRTGDYVRFRPDGKLEFAGRIDGQIKLRGHRIETGEIESSLLGIPGIVQAAVRLEGEHLVAYVVKSEDAGSQKDVRKSVSAILPDYMIPSYVVTLDRLPRNTSGKIDLGSVPFFRPQVKNDAGTVSGQVVDGLRAGITRAWSSVLKHEGTGLDDNFFDLGGHSMMLVRLKEQIRVETGREISVLNLLRYSTISRQAEFLGQGLTATPEPLVPRAIRSGGAVAIIGMAGRFPEAGNVEEYWRNLCEGRDCISFFSRAELLAAGVPPEMADDPDYVPANGILREHDRFDAEFFGVPAREAEVMDPQQRLLLEESWHAFEDAGLDPAAIEGRVGVFIGSSLNTYLFENVLPHRNVVENLGSFAVMISNDKDFSATRVSYKLGLRGPSMSVNTACSTSLVAIHQAVTAIHDGQCELALAGGACVRSRQVDGYNYELGGILSRDGSCRAFDAGATGMIGGNGVALVLLKPLEQALADGDHIHAVIRGIAVNNDGSDKIGFTAPSITGQSMVIRDALQRAGVEPETVLYAETHGTGTKLGDSIEVAALAENYASARRKQPLFIGSVKTNIGHLDSAAGAAGLIKAVLSLYHKTLVPSLHFREPNPQIPWPGDRMLVSTDTCRWEGGNAPLRASVSSFGIGGTNAHAILEEPPARLSDAVSDDGSPRLLLFSGKNEHALQANAGAFAEWLERHGDGSLNDAAYTLAFGRRHWEFRGAVLAASEDEARDLLSDPLVTVDSAENVAFMFSGMGAHHPGMGSSLYGRSQVFKDCIDECAAILVPILGLDIRTLLLASYHDASASELLNQHQIGQPAVFTLEYALAMFWIEMGVRPSVLIGHSLGEWVAACVAGVFSLPDALRIVSLRGKLMEAQQKGGMLAVHLAEPEVISILPDGLDIATVNSSDQVVVAGPVEMIERFSAELRRTHVQCKLLQVHLAAHSSLMEPALEPLRAAIEAVPRNAPDPAMAVVSNITGTYVPTGELQSPAYWTSHLRQCVRFADGLATLWSCPKLALLECGPGNTLCNIAQRDVRKPDNRMLATTIYGDGSMEGEWRGLLNTAGILWTAGLPVDLKKLFGLLGSSGHRIPLPGYAFQRRRYWLSEAATPGVAAIAPAVAEVAGSAPAPTVSNLSPTEEQVILFMQELLGPVSLGRHRDFFLCGGNSLLAVRLASRLRAVFGIPVTPREVMKERTPAKIAALIEDTGASSKAHRTADSSVVLLAKGNIDLPPIVLVHAVGGGIFIYRELLQALDTSHPVYGLQAPGLWDDSAPIEGVRCQAEHYHACLVRAGVDRPVMLAGSSYGGLVCYELDRLYRASGHKPAILALFDSPGPGHMPARMESEAEICAWMLSRDMPGRSYEADLERMIGLDHEGRVALLLEEIRKDFMPYATDREVSSLLRVFSQNLANMWQWLPEPHDTSILFFKAQEYIRMLAESPELAWVPLASGGLDIITVPGDHSSMLSFPHVCGIADDINRRLSVMDLNCGHAHFAVDFPAK
ncbi:MAG: amino acid adenylation domain-containing protein [Chlorobiaceae bacterium]|nr:amino acid adenylation domain-containing protein [Chlorobiaceae bacterium]